MLNETNLTIHVIHSGIFQFQSQKWSHPYISFKVLREKLNGFNNENQDQYIASKIA